MILIYFKMQHKNFFPFHFFFGWAKQRPFPFFLSAAVIINEYNGCCFGPFIHLTYCNMVQWHTRDTANDPSPKWEQGRGQIQWRRLALRTHDIQVLYCGPDRSTSYNSITHKHLCLAFIRLQSNTIQRPVYPSHLCFASRSSLIGQFISSFIVILGHSFCCFLHPPTRNPHKHLESPLFCLCCSVCLLLSRMFVLVGEIKIIFLSKNP